MYNYIIYITHIILYNSIGCRFGIVRPVRSTINKNVGPRGAVVKWAHRSTLLQKSPLALDINVEVHAHISVKCIFIYQIIKYIFKNNKKC